MFLLLLNTIITYEWLVKLHVILYCILIILALINIQLIWRFLSYGSLVMFFWNFSNSWLNPLTYCVL